VLTRLSVQGFRNLLDVDLRLGPLTALVGPNGAGKTNLLAAIRFLSLLARHPIAEAVRRLAGAEPGPLPTRFAGRSAPRLRLAAELIVRREVTDDLGVPTTAAKSTVRWALTLRPGEGGALELEEESLRPIRQADAHRDTRAWARLAFRDSVVSGRRRQPFVSTGGAVDRPSLRIHQEGLATRRVPARSAPCTMVCGAASAELPTLLAVRRELEAWRTLELEPGGSPRLSALEALAGDRRGYGTWLVEEPDNAIHPARIPELMALLRRIAVDPSRPAGEDNPVRQVLFTTHSPVMVEEVSPAQELVHLDPTEVERDGVSGCFAVPRYPAGSWRCAAAGEATALPPWKLEPYFRRASAPRQLELPTEPED